MAEDKIGRLTYYMIAKSIRDTSGFEVEVILMCKTFSALDVVQESLLLQILQENGGFVMIVGPSMPIGVLCMNEKQLILD